MALKPLLALLVGVLTVQLAWAQDMFIYPAAGQSADQQQKDEYECYNFGKQNSGFDPMAAPTATTAKPQNEGASTGRRTLRGAGLGAAVGGIVDGSDGAKKGAAAGAVTGLLFGGAKSRDTQKQQQQWEQEQQQIYAQNRTSYNRAFAACMEGRDYTVR
jgi:hypothetical protein